MLVNNNTIATTNNTMAVTPEILPPKYKPPIINAAEILMVLSKSPTFCFIMRKL